MRVTAMNKKMLAFFFFLALSRACAFEVALPQNTLAVGENMSVNITANDSATYDVKIFIHDANKTLLSEVYAGKWKNPFYYLKEAYPTQSSFIIRATRNSEDAALCVRLRKTGTMNYQENCTPLVLMPAKPSEPEALEPLHDEPLAAVSPPAVDLTESAAVNEPPNLQTMPNTSTSSEENPARIFLSPPQQTGFTTPEQEFHTALLYAVVIAVFGASILFFYRKWRRKL